MDIIKLPSSHITICSLGCFLASLYTFAVVQADLFTSTDDLRKLSEAELELTDDIEAVAKKLEDKLNLLKIILANLRHDQNKVNDGLEIAGHPVHAYNMIKRWRYIQDFFEKSDEKDRKKAVPIQLDCKDTHENCAEWARQGECKKNPKYMLQSCKLSCEVCRDKPSKDLLVGELLGKLQLLTGKKAPELENLAGAAHGLVRLQRTYKLSTKKIIEGNIFGSKSMSKLTPTDCLYIGQQANIMNEWGYAEQWLQRAQTYNTEPLLIPQIKLELFKAYLGMKDTKTANETVYEAFNGNLPVIHGPVCVDEDDNCAAWKANGECEKNSAYMLQFCKYSCNHQNYCRGHENFPGEKELTNAYSWLQRLIRRQRGVNTVPKPNRIRAQQQDFQPGYEKLCRGEGTKKYPDAVCRYRQALLPYYLYKEEILCMNPRIAMVYDVVSDIEGEYIKELAKSKMDRAMVGTDRRISSVRVSKVGWLADDIPFIRRLSERVEMITGLEATLRISSPQSKHYVKSSDDLQIVNYGIGGHYEPHTDYFEFNTEQDLKSDIYRSTQESGDRIATFLMYLTDVKAGGGTVYPRAKVYVPPVKNAAAFWFNSELSGRYDPLTLHAGCPVLLGEKWVCNKWIREFGNHFNRKCALTKDAKYS